MTSTKNACRILGLGVLLFAPAIYAAEPSDPAKAGKQPAPESSSSKELPGVKALRNLEYARVGDKKLLLDLYLPEKPQGPLPLVIWIHGGAWLGGDKADCPARRLVQRGYAVASVNYRLSNEAIFPAQIKDCKAAVRWLRAHTAEYGLDAGHFGVWGASAGGHLVALLGTSGDTKDFDKGENLGVSSRVQAVCDWFGPTDLLQMQGALRRPGP